MASNPQSVDVIKVQVDYLPATGTFTAGTEVDSITLHQSINSIPYAEIGLQPAAGDVRVYPVDEALQISEMEALQRFAFSDRGSVAEIQIRLSSSEESIGFSGMPIAPTKSVGFGAIEQRIKLYGGEIMLNSFRPYIYASVPGGANDVNRETRGTGAPSGTNVVERAVKLVTERMDNLTDPQRGPMLTSLVAEGSDAATVEMARQIHNVNMQQFPRLQQIANLSTEAVYESWAELEALPNEGEVIQQSVNLMMLDMLLTSSGNFFEAFTSFLSSFQMYYVPEANGNGYGRVRPYRTMLEESGETETKIIDAAYLSFSAEDYDYGPISQVLVQGVFAYGANRVAPQKITEAQALVPELRTNTIFAFPEEVTVVNGNFRPVGPPAWLPATVDLFKEWKEPTSRVLQGGWEIKDYTGYRDLLNESLDRVMKGPYASIIKEYAKNIYLQSALAAYTAVARVPLDFSWKVGQRYEVRSQENKLLFTGFLTQLNHNISGIRNNLSAWTTLVFSHVEYGYFELHNG